MSPPASKLRVHYQGLYDQAKRRCKPNPDGSYVEICVQSELARMVRADLDLDHAAMLKAKKIIEKLSKQDGEEDDDDDDSESTQQLELFGDTYAYNPQRLIKDAIGNIIEEDKATLSFLLAELARSTQHMSRVAIWNNRKARKAQHFQKWHEQQTAAGRSSLELTWGNCARETNVIRKKA